MLLRPSRIALLAALLGGLAGAGTGVSGAPVPGVAGAGVAGAGAAATPGSAIPGAVISAAPTAAVAIAVHEVPASVAVQMYVAPRTGPDGPVLHLLVRIPLEAARDMDWPLVGPGYLALDALGDRLSDAARLWIADDLVVLEDGRPLGDETVRGVRLTLPGDRSYRSWEDARTHVTEFDPGPTGTGLSADTRIVPEQALLDAWLTVPIRDPDARFSLEPRLARLGIETVSVIHFVRPDGTERAFRYRGDPGLVRLDPTWGQTALHFLVDGVRHILGGIDHLLFLLVLILPFRSLRPVVPVVTAFTVAHSITLASAALGLTPQAAWFPALVETLIAASIVWMAVENLLGVGLRRRWQLAFAFGLVHGFGFSFVLGETLQFAGAHLVSALLAFNLGVELGQVALVALAVPALNLALRRIPRRPAVLVLTALAAHEAWHWMTARGRDFLAYDPALPAAGPDLVAGLTRWGLVAAITVAVAWGLAELYARWRWVSQSLAGEPVSAAKQ